MQFHPIFHWLIIYGIATSTRLPKEHVSHKNSALLSNKAMPAGYYTKFPWLHPNGTESYGTISGIGKRYPLNQSNGFCYCQFHVQRPPIEPFSKAATDTRGWLSQDQYQLPNNPKQSSIVQLSWEIIDSTLESHSWLADEIMPIKGRRISHLQHLHQGPMLRSFQYFINWWHRGIASMCNHQLFASWTISCKASIDDQGSAIPTSEAMMQM